LEAESTGEPQRSVFFDIYAEVATENGDCMDLSYAPVLKEGRVGFQIDGFSVDIERGELHLAVSDFRSERDLQGLNAERIDFLFKRLTCFCENAFNPEFLNSLEETSPTFEAAYSIFEHAKKIRRIRAVIFSNAKLATRRKSVESGEVAGRAITFGVLDFSRYADIQRSLGRHEPIEVDVEEHYGAPLPCLEAHSQDGACASYLVVLPGTLLADIYGLYGARLLEQNVRTFLQAKTKVNKGIIQTITDKPEMFFSYNNGLTATASGIELVKLVGSGAIGIRSISDLQIVNGGQTTASILYARDQANRDLDKVFVQMKLSVVKPEEIEVVVPLISRYANTQNRVSETDFFSNHPYHIEMEKISRRLTAPPQDGQLYGSKWFYERARGQYKDILAYSSKAEKQRTEIEFPKLKKFDKTELSKFIVAFECKPYMISRGAQKCFLFFAEQVTKQWNNSPTYFNDEYFKEVAAKALIYRWTDKMVGTSDWYKADRGHKAHTVAYTISWIIHYYETKQKKVIDLLAIWKQQDMPVGLQGVVMCIAPQVAGLLKKTPDNVRDVREYCKQLSCWEKISETTLDIGKFGTLFLTDFEEREARRTDALKIKKIDSGIDFDVTLISLFPVASDLQRHSELKGFLSPKSASALRKLMSGALSLTKSEKNALKLLLERAKESGFKLPQ
jgi:hypothetical protein